MAPKNLLPVAALCSALASGMPLAAWATPATANSSPQALNPVADSSGIVACQRFSLAHATVRTSGCLHRNTVDAIVVDIKRPNKENGPQTGCAICTWKSAAVDADGDPCDLELRIDIASVDDSANGAKVVFDSAAYEEGGGVCLGCVPSNADGAQPIISFTASLRLTKADTEAIATGDAPLLFYAGDADDQEAQSTRQKGSLNLTRGSEPAPINIDAQEPGVQRILADPALLQMTWQWGPSGLLLLYRAIMTNPPKTRSQTHRCMLTMQTMHHQKATLRPLSRSQAAPPPNQAIPNRKTAWNLPLPQMSTKATVA